MAEDIIEKTAPKERSVPITHFTDAEAGAKEFPPRAVAPTTTSSRSSAAPRSTRT